MVLCSFLVVVPRRSFGAVLGSWRFVVPGSQLCSSPFGGCEVVGVAVEARPGRVLAPRCPCVLGGFPGVSGAVGLPRLERSSVWCCREVWASFWGGCVSLLGAGFPVGGVSGRWLFRVLFFVRVGCDQQEVFFRSFAALGF